MTPSYRSLALMSWVCCGAFAVSASGGEKEMKPIEERGLLVCVAPDAPEAIRDVAAELAKNPDAALPLRAALAASGPHQPARLADPAEFDLYNWRNVRGHYPLIDNHLVLIGLWDSDQLLRKAKGWYAALTVDPPTFRSEGYGRFTGGVGFVETLPNPWLHSDSVIRGTHETLLFRITGTTPEAVLLAYDAFVGGMLNGVVLAPDARRARPTLLDFDPSAEPCPLSFPETVVLPPNYAPGLQAPGEPFGAEPADFTARYMGWTQPAGEEYRTYEELAGHAPQSIWRLKWLGAGTLNRIDNDTWWNGPHRAASGNAVIAVRFETPEAAAETLAAVEKLGWRPWTHDGITGLSGDFSYRGPRDAPWQKLGEDLNRPLLGAAKGPWLILTALPEAVTARWIHDHVPNR